MQNQSLRHQASFSVQTRPHPIKMPWKNPRSHDEREGRGQPKKDFSVQHYLLLVIYEMQSSNIHLLVTVTQLGNLSGEPFMPRNHHKLDITQRISLLVRSSWLLFIHTANILVERQPHWRPLPPPHSNPQNLGKTVILLVLPLMAALITTICL